MGTPRHTIDLKRHKKPNISTLRPPKNRKMEIFGVIFATFFVGDYVQALCAPRVRSANDCQKLCQVTTDCQHYTFIGSNKKCYMKKAFGWSTHYNKNGSRGEMVLRCFFVVVDKSSNNM